MGNKYIGNERKIINVYDIEQLNYLANKKFKKSYWHLTTIEKSQIKQDMPKFNNI